MPVPCTAQDSLQQRVSFYFPMLTDDGQTAANMSHLYNNENSETEHGDTSNSLSDSSYEWVGRPTVHQSDDEDASVSSFNISTAGETASLSGSEDSEELHAARMSPELYIRDTTLPSQLLVQHPHAVTAENSTLTTREDQRTVNSAIKFEESSDMTGNEHVDVVYALSPCNPSEDELEQEMQSAHPQRVITLRQTMSSKMLELKRPLRILYVGDLQPKDEIIEKVAQAIAATSADCLGKKAVHSSSKLSIVAVSSFGQSASSPQVALIPSTGLELIVDHFTEADYLRLCESGHRALKKLFESADLAIMFHSTHIGMLMQKLRQEDMFAVVRQLGVPTIEVAEDGQSETMRDFTPYKGRAIHVCLETQDSDLGDNKISQVMPVELSVFLGLDPCQLNRNIACIISQSNRRTGLMNRVDTKDVLTNIAKMWGWVKGLTSSIGHFRTCAWARIVHLQTQNPRGALFTLVLALLLGYFLSFLPVLTNSNANSSHAHVAATIDVLQIPGMAPFTSVSSSAPLEHVVAATTSVITSSTNTEAGTTLATVNSKSSVGIYVSPADLLQVKPSDDSVFHLLTSDDDKVYLLLPKMIVNMWRPPPVFIKGVQHGKLVQVEFYNLDSRGAKGGTLGVMIPEREFSGCLEIQVWTEKSPMLEQTFKICKPLPKPNRDAFKEIAIRLSQEGMRLSNVASKLSHQGSRLGHAATRAVAQSGLSLQALLNQSEHLQRRSIEYMQQSKSQLHEITTAIGEHFATNHVWVRAGWEERQEKASKRLHHLQKRASKDLRKCQKNVARRLHKAQMKATKDWARASKDIAKVSRDIALWREGATYELSQRIQEAREMIKYERPADLWKLIPVVSHEHGPLMKARSRARKLWQSFPGKRSRQQEGKYKSFG